MEKVALFVFDDSLPRFFHALLNGLDMQKREMDVRIIIEGKATTVLPKLIEPDHPLHKYWEKAKAQGIVDGVCKVCAQNMGMFDEAVKQGLPLLEHMSGHPSMAHYMAEGFTVITF